MRQMTTYMTYVHKSFRKNSVKFYNFIYCVSLHTFSVHMLTHLKSHTRTWVHRWVPTNGTLVDFVLHLEWVVGSVRREYREDQ